MAENENNTIAFDALVVLVLAGDPMVVAQIRFKDQKTVFIDGAKDPFKYYFRISAYQPGRSVADIGVIYLTDYYTVTFIDAIQAFFLVGGDVYGPMGRGADFPEELQWVAQSCWVEKSGRNVQTEARFQSGRRPSERPD